jgi:hypothetical protein
MIKIFSETGSTSLQLLHAGKDVKWFSIFISPTNENKIHYPTIEEGIDTIRKTYRKIGYSMFSEATDLEKFVALSIISTPTLNELEEKIEF